MNFKRVLFMFVISLLVSFASIGNAKSYGRGKKRFSNGGTCSHKVSPPQASPDTSGVAKKCSTAEGHGEVRTLTCIQWVATQATKSLEKDPACTDKVTVPLMMCIFKKEVSWYSYNPCGVNGCGLSQMTSAGVSTVKRGLSNFGLTEEYDYFWDLVGRPGEKENKCKLSRKSALDRDTSVIMAATHLCAEAKAKRKDTSYILARDYNGSRTKNEYARFVTSCMKSGSWKNDPVRKQLRSGTKSQCRGYKSCGGRRLTRKHRKNKQQYSSEKSLFGVV